MLDMLENILEDAPCFLKVWSAQCLDWPIVIRAHAPRHTSPQDSPSGVSEGQSMPHCDGCSERGPLTLRVFSNCELIRVTIPSAAMKDSRERTWV